MDQQAGSFDGLRLEASEGAHQREQAVGGISVFGAEAQPDDLPLALLQHTSQALGVQTAGRGLQQHDRRIKMGPVHRVLDFPHN